MSKQAGMIHGIVAAALLMLAGAASAAPTVKILHYGLYSAESDPVEQARIGPAGRYRLLERTRQVPLRIGTRFGFCAQLDGLEAVDGRYTLTEIVRHPVMTLPNGTEAGGWNVPRMLTVKDGSAVWCGGHQFLQMHELVPGRWRFTVGDSDADLIVEEFEAVGDPAAR